MIRINNRGDFAIITLDSGHTVTVDGPKLRRLTGNDQIRYVADLIVDAIASLRIPSGPIDAATASTPINSPWNGKLPPITNPDMVVEPYVPSGLSQDDDD